MTAKSIVARILEDGPPVDPDEPSAFLKHYKSAWERAGFVLIDHTDRRWTLRETQQSWIWQDGAFSVEVGFDGTEYVITGFINNVPGDVEARSQSAYASKSTKTEAKALAAAIQMRKEIAGSVAARLSKLGFVGWRRDWHKGPIRVVLKPSKNGGYANIKVAMDYVPSADVIRVVTGLDKMCSKLYPDH